MLRKKIMKNISKLSSLVLSLFVFSGCATLMGDPENNVVIYGYGKTINISPEFKYVGATKNHFQSDDSGGFYLKGSHTQRNHIFVKPNEKTNVEEIVCIQNETLHHNWTYTSKNPEIEYGSFLIPNGGRLSNDIRKLSKNNNMNVNGIFNYIIFNYKYTDNSMDRTIYLLLSENIPSELKGDDVESYVRNKALDAINKEKALNRDNNKKPDTKELLPVNIDKRYIENISIEIFQSGKNNHFNFSERFYSEVLSLSNDVHIFYNLNVSVIENLNRPIDFLIKETWIKNGEVILNAKSDENFERSYATLSIWNGHDFSSKKFGPGNYEIILEDIHGSLIGAKKFKVID
jgi:hypothetical protein